MNLLTFGINYECKTNGSFNIFVRCLINELLTSKVLFEKFCSQGTDFIHFLLEYKNGYCAHYKYFIVFVLWIRFQ